MKKRIVFDLDGTLVHSMPGIAVGLNRALACLGRSPLTQEHVASLIGCGVRNLCARALGYADEFSAPEDVTDALIAHFRREYSSCWREESPQPYPGIPHLIDELSRRGEHLAIFSNKQHDVTFDMVRHVFGEQTFSPIIGHTGQFPRKPAPDALLHIAKLWSIPAQQLVLVGDSLIDAATAHAAGSQLILVSWGYSQGKDLSVAHCPIAHSAEELGKLLLSDTDRREEPRTYSLW